MDVLFRSIGIRLDLELEETEKQVEGRPVFLSASSFVENGVTFKVLVIEYNTFSAFFVFHIVIEAIHGYGQSPDCS